MKRYLLLAILFFPFGILSAQQNVIDKIVAIVGEEIILKSDIENAYLQDQGRGIASSSSDYRAGLLENLLVQKLLMAQAQVDSVSVTEDQVESAVESQIDYLISYLSSVMTLEKGDVILTGTPKGVSAMESGDVIECEIESLGILRNSVI